MLYKYLEYDFCAVVTDTQFSLDDLIVSFKQLHATNQDKNAKTYQDKSSETSLSDLVFNIYDMSINLNLTDLKYRLHVFNSFHDTNLSTDDLKKFKMRMKFSKEANNVVFQTNIPITYNFILSSDLSSCKAGPCSELQAMEFNYRIKYSKDAFKAFSNFQKEFESNNNTN